MTKEELESELDEVISEIGDILDTFCNRNVKLDTLYFIKKITCCDDTVYESFENNRIYTECDNALDVFDEKANLIKRIFKKITQFEYFTEEEKKLIIQDKVNVEDLNKRKILLEEKEKELRVKIHNLSMIEDAKCVPKTSLLSKFLEWFKI